MSFVFEKPQGSALDNFAGGTATFGELARASYDAAVYVDNTISSAYALEKAYDDRIAAVTKATGVTLENPMRRGYPDVEELAEQQPGENLYFTRKRIFDRHLAEIQKRHPGAWEAIRAGEPIESDAKRIAGEADARLGRFAASRSDVLGKWTAMLGGGLFGFLRDPIQAPLLLVGGGLGAGKTVATRVLSVAAKEALINGASEAVLQPFVQAWREKAGLDHGMRQALINVGTATAFGGILGGAGGTLEALGRRLSGEALDAAGEVAAADPRIDADLRAGMEGDGQAAARSLKPIREALPADARGALDEAALIAHDAEAKPAAIAPEAHDRAVAAAIESDRTGERVFPEPDPDHVARVTDTIVPRRSAAAEDRPASLADFLIDTGGVGDFQGELKAIGAERLKRRFRGNLVREGGRDLDKAREAAAEAGYLDGLYGSPEAAVSRSTVADLLDLLGEEAAGNPVYRPEDLARAAAAPDDGRGRVEDLVHELLQQAGPGIEDRLIARAVEKAVADGIDPFDALESVIVAEAARAPEEFYHGTPYDFAEFDLGKSGTASGSKTERAVFFTPDRGEAANFGLSARGEPSTVYVRRHAVDTEDFIVVDMEGARARHHAIRSALDEARAADAPGVIFRNMDDRSVAEAGAGGAIRDQIAVLDLSRISPAAKIEKVNVKAFFGRPLDKAAVAHGDFGPVFTADQFASWSDAVDYLWHLEDGELVGFLANDATGPIDLPWGFYDAAKDNGLGLAKIMAKHPEVLDGLPEIIAALPEVLRTANRVTLDDGTYRAVVRLDNEGKSKTWLLTAFEKRRRTGETTDRPGGLQADGHSSSASPADGNIGAGDDIGNEASFKEARRARLRNPSVLSRNAGERTGDLPPGWSDAELLAASEARGTMPGPVDDAPEPDALPPEEAAIDPADIEALGELPIADDAGNMVSVADFLAEADRGDEMARLVELCRA